MRVTGAPADFGSGVDGYSIMWTRQPRSFPDSVKEQEASAGALTSPRLGNGRWYFHLRTVDNAGNASTALHRGPFLIDGTPPRLRALPGRGRVGRLVLLRYRIYENTKRTREQVTVLRTGRVLRTVRTRMGFAKPGFTYSVGWRPRRTQAGTLRFCVRAWDPARNASRASCAALRIQAPRPTGGGGGNCHPGYSPCLPIVADLDCGQIPDSKKPVKVLGDDPYRLDADGDGWGCE